jgi:hypothetical protein
MGKYAGWIMLFAVAGTLAAIAAIAITEAFVPSTLLVLTAGEYELLAGVFYVLAILLYLGEGGFGSKSRAVGRVAPIPTFKNVGTRRLTSARTEQYDASYNETLEAAEA